MSKIFFFWDNPATLPVEYRANIDIAKVLHPAWEVILVDNESALEDLKSVSPQLFDNFSDIKVPAAKSDIIRLVKLFLHGGWYFDCDLRIYRNLEFFDLAEPVLFERDDTDWPRITNMAMYFPKAHPMLMECIKIIEGHIRNDLYCYDVWRFSGPGVLNSLAYKYGYYKGKANSFNEHFLLPMKTFDTVTSNTTNSWIFQQAFGILKSHPANYNKLPLNNPNDINNLLNHIDNLEDKTSLLEQVIRFRGEHYLNHSKFETLVLAELANIGDFNLLKELWDKTTEGKLRNNLSHRLHQIDANFEYMEKTKIGPPAPQPNNEARELASNTIQVTFLARCASFLRRKVGKQLS